MSPHAYSEDQLIERSAIGLFAALGRQTVSALEEDFSAGGLAAIEVTRVGCQVMYFYIYQFGILNEDFIP